VVAGNIQDRNLWLKIMLVLFTLLTLIHDL
jgi:hypothetical protein